MWGQGEPPTPRNSIGGKEEGGGGEKEKEKEKKGREMSPLGDGAGSATSVEWRRCWLAAAGR